MLEKKEGEVDSASGKEEKEKATGDGDEGKEKDAEDTGKEREEKEKTSDTGEKDTPAVKSEGSEGKTDSEEDKSKGETDDNTVFKNLQLSLSMILTVLLSFQLRRAKRKRWTPPHLQRRRKVHPQTLQLCTFH